jgi:hypothetical protein
MKQRPIIFNTAMVQAILDGNKTQTRRTMKPQPTPCDYTNPNGSPKGGHWYPSNIFQTMVHVESLMGNEPIWDGVASDACPICSVGDRLWVRETFCIGKYEAEDRSPECGGELIYISQCFGDNDVIFKQHALDIGCNIEDATWKPSIHMPRAAARILLEVTAVRVERLNDISLEDAAKEGFDHPAVPSMGWKFNAKHNFKFTWNQIYNNWESNPFVWVIEFKVISTTGGAV